MALETLKGVEEIDGFKVIIMDELREKYPEKFNESGSMNYEWFEKEIRPNNFVYVRHDVNSLSFTIQNGPIGENGVNGCQVDTIAATLIKMIDELNKKFPSIYNDYALSHFTQGLDSLKARKADREKRNVEGKSEL